MEDSPPHRAHTLGHFHDVGVGVSLGTPTSEGYSDGVTVTAEFGYRKR